MESPAPPLIRLRDLTKVYEEGVRTRTVFRGLNVQVAAGECVVLLGRSGSGKSTLLNLIGGIDLPTDGEVLVRVDGREVNLARLSERERTLFRRARVGFIFQFYNLIPTLTVAENVRLPLELNGHAAQAERAAELLAAVGLADRGASFPDRLSGGEQQRVAIARALVHDPALLLADEPTGNLDIESGRTVLDLLDRLVRQRGKTLVMVTHSPEVIGVADRVLTMRDGRLVEHAPAAEIAADGAGR